MCILYSVYGFIQRIHFVYVQKERIMFGLELGNGRWNERYEWAIDGSTAAHTFYVCDGRDSYTYTNVHICELYQQTEYNIVVSKEAADTLLPPCMPILILWLSAVICEQPNEFELFVVGRASRASRASRTSSASSASS